jgi:prephenate dehydratase
MSNTKLRMAFRGTRGAYAEEAAERFFEGDIEVIPFRSREEVCEALEGGEVERAVVPIENTLGGLLHRTFDFLLQREAWISGEVIIGIVRNLIVNPGVEFKDIKRVYSHPQGLAQCRRFLSQNPNIEKVSVYESAAGVKLISELGLRDAAAIASRQAAHYYRSVVIKEGIQDIESNYSRYLILSKTKDIADDANQTSIVFSTKDVPGMLFRSLGVFALRDINIGRVTSWPVNRKKREYFLYLDIEENLKQDRMTKAIAELELFSNYVKILGCYRRSE